MKRFLGLLLTIFLTITVLAPPIAVGIYDVDIRFVNIMSAFSISFIWYVTINSINDFVKKHLDIEP